MTDHQAYLNLIEPDSYPRLFFDHPPAGFDVGLSPSGLPLFMTGFDLLTTFDPALRHRLKKAPLFKYWSGILNWSACFWGTTITEYAPLPLDMNPAEAAEEMLGQARNASLAIIKDLPLNSPLLPARDNEYSQSLAEAALERGFFELSGQALAYVPIDFADTDEYLSRLSYSRRKDLRRKMKSAAGLSVEALELGDPLLGEPAVLADFYEMYLEVFRQSEIHFDLLSADFFKTLLSGRFAPGLAVIYRQDQTAVGVNICLTHGDWLIDKYIGFRYPLARQLNLYFVSWLYNLDLALRRGFKFYVAGWTDPKVKASLGADFTFTRHLVRIRNPFLRRAMRPLRRLFEADKKTVESL
jgi:predicted N-acyltransferase